MLLLTLAVLLKFVILSAGALQDPQQLAPQHSPPSFNTPSLSIQAQPSQILPQPPLPQTVGGSTNYLNNRPVPTSMTIGASTTSAGNSSQTQRSVPQLLDTQSSLAKPSLISSPRNAVAQSEHAAPSNSKPTHLATVITVDMSNLTATSDSRASIPAVPITTPSPEVPFELISTTKPALPSARHLANLTDVSPTITEPSSVHMHQLSPTTINFTSTTAQLPSPVIPNQDASIQTTLAPNLARSSAETSVTPPMIATQATAAPTLDFQTITNRPTSPKESRRVVENSGVGSSVQILRPKTIFKCKNTTDCLNGGVCFNGVCFCMPGFTGNACETDIDECRLEPGYCLNNSTCIDEVHNVRCECSPGYKGERCQDAIDMCVGGPCKNEARCINARIDYTCECAPGWEGRHCEENIDECQKNPCQNNGTCHDLVNDYLCDCGLSGFTGKNCEVDFDDCAARPCGFGAKECLDLTGDFKCICHDGFTGKKCDIDIDECQSNPCENNGTCIQNSHHNLTSDLNMFHEMKEFGSNLNMSQFAGFECACKEEFFGPRCEERKKCYTKSVAELCNHPQAECVNFGGSYECLINASFDGSGQKYAIYKIIGEFKLREIFVKYRSLTGGIIMSFEYSQPDPIADLKLNKSGIYLSGTPIKPDETIKFDFFLDGSEREIRLELDSPTEIKTIYLARQPSIDNHNVPFKGCLMQVRLNNQLLPFVEYGASLNQSFEFTKNLLEVGQCRTCFEKDCLNHGQCEFQEGYDHCSCPDAFTGNFCELDVNECEKIHCLNGGTCENFHGGYRCNCREGYRGEKCQDISDYCKAKQPCVTGVCKNMNLSQGTYHCECPSSHIGKRCERKRDCLNECHSQYSLCVNNVTCACLPGRRDEKSMCEYIASCEQVEGELCLNGGTCKNSEIGGYSCICPEPFYGPICQLVMQKSQFGVITLIAATCALFVVGACLVMSLVVFRSVRKARATRGTYSPSTQEKFGNAASDLLKLPIPERLI